MKPIQADMWVKTANLEAISYTCGHCSCYVGSNLGLSHHVVRAHIRICPNCGRATYLESGLQVPGPLFGDDVQHLENMSVYDLYNEARRAFSVNSFTAAVLCCRKLLMNIAVTKGAPEGQRFIEYVEYLSDNNFIPPDAREWVDYIRQRGNEATHEIQLMTRDDAELLIRFTEMLLRQVFEFPAIIKKLRGTTPAP